MADEVTCLACNDGFELTDDNTCEEEKEEPQTPEGPEPGRIMIQCN